MGGEIFGANSATTVVLIYRTEMRAPLLRLNLLKRTIPFELKYSPVSLSQFTATTTIHSWRTVLHKRIDLLGTEQFAIYLSL